MNLSTWFMNISHITMLKASQSDWTRPENPVSFKHCNEKILKFCLQLQFHQSASSRCLIVLCVSSQFLNCCVCLSCWKFTGVRSASDAATFSLIWTEENRQKDKLTQVFLSQVRSFIWLFLAGNLTGEHKRYSSAERELHADVEAFRRLKLFLLPPSNKLDDTFNLRCVHPTSSLQQRAARSPLIMSNLPTKIKGVEAGPHRAVRQLR